MSQVIFTASRAPSRVVSPDPNRTSFSTHAGEPRLPRERLTLLGEFAFPQARGPFPIRLVSFQALTWPGNLARPTTACPEATRSQT